MKPAIIACGAALQYLSDTEHPNLGHITSISRIEEEKYVWLDRFTIRNLELFGSQNDNANTIGDEPFQIFQKYPKFHPIRKLSIVKNC